MAIFRSFFGSFFKMPPRYKMGIHWPGEWDPWLKTYCLGSILSVLNIGYPTQGGTGAYVGSHIWGSDHSEYRAQKGSKGRFRQNEPKMFIDDPCCLSLGMWEDDRSYTAMKHAFISIFSQNDPVTPSGPYIRYYQNLICETTRRYLISLGGVSYVQNT